MDLAPTAIIIIIIVAIILFGSSKIPELFRSLGKAIGEFRKGRMEAEMEMMQMQQQLAPNSPTLQNQTSQGLEEKIKQLEKELEELKKQKSQQS
ncbi:MAG: twin-arginine translocase TatA/TatE family subunit [Sulfolobaceae archaeon]